MYGNRRFSPVHSADEITPEVVTERLSYRLQKLIGTGRRWSYLGVASRTQIDVRTLKAYVQGTACPSLVKYKQLLAVLGPEIGIEFNLMKGWPPRSAVVPPEAVDLAELRLELRHTLHVLEEVLELDERVDAHSAAPIADVDELLPDAHDPDGPGIETLPEFRTPLRVEDIDAGAVAIRLGYRLQKMIGPGCAWSLADASDATGIDRRTLQSYLAGEASPNLTRYHRLGFVFGPQVGVELACMIGWEPRYTQPVVLPRRESAELEDAIRHAVRAIDALLAPSRGHPVRLIRSNDRVEPPLATRTAVSDERAGTAEVHRLRSIGEDG